MARKKGKNRKEKSFSLVIVCGEKTEKSYINKVIKEHPDYNHNSIKVEVFDSSIGGISKILKTYERKPKVNEVHNYFIIMDLEGKPNTENYSSFYETYSKIKKEYPNFKIITSLPSIEYWFLLHKNQYSNNFLNAKEVIKMLNNEIHEFRTYNTSTSKDLTQSQIIYLSNNINIAIKNCNDVKLNIDNYYRFNNKQFKTPHTNMEEFLKILKK